MSVQSTLPSLARLTVRRVETFPVRVPLARVYRGSAYQMTHRSTIVARIHTDEGIVGEAYAGDEDASLAEIESQASSSAISLPSSRLVS